MKSWGWGPRAGISVLTRRDPREPAISLSVKAWKRGHVSTQQGGDCLQAKRRALTVNATCWHLILDSQPPELWEINFCCLSPPSMVSCYSCLSYDTHCNFSHVTNMLLNRNLWTHFWQHPTNKSLELKLYACFLCRSLTTVLWDHETDRGLTALYTQAPPPASPPTLWVFFFSLITILKVIMASYQVFCFHFLDYQWIF